MIENLKRQAEAICHESIPNANTASKVGEVLVGLVDEIDEISQLSHEAIKTTDELLNMSLNEINGEATQQETIMQKFYNILNSKKAIKQAIENKGINMSDDPRLSLYAERIGSIQERNPTWTPNATWWDIKSIVQESNNREYTYKTIQLLADSEVTTTFTGGVAYKTSDGQYYSSTNVTHSWNRAKDKQCIEDGENAYKTRWVITYHSSRTIEFTYLQKSCLYFVMDGILPVVVNFNVKQSTSSMILLKSFEKINGADFTRVTDFSYMFEGCFFLQTIPQIDTSNGTNFNSMFVYCIELISIPPLNTSKGISFSTMFAFCTALKSISLSSTSNATDFNNMFVASYSLSSISTIDFSKGTGSNSEIFNSCLKTKSLKIKNLSKELNLSRNEFIDHESLLYLINNLAIVTTKPQLKLGEANLSKLTAAEKAIATNKGWILA